MSPDADAALSRIFALLNEAALEPSDWVEIGFIVQMVGLSKSDPSLANLIIADLPDILPERVAQFRAACEGLPGPIGNGRAH